MSHTTRFLSRLLGLYCAIAGLLMMGRRDATVDIVTGLVADPPLMFTLGVLMILGGLAMVLAHNVWSGGLAARIVTLLGWAVLLKGVLFLVFASHGAAEFYLGALQYAKMFYFYASVALLLGLFLTYAGFKASR
jgi:hypothetical protein